MVFIDQYSGYTFIYLQRRLTSEETVQDKHAFERSADQRGVKILHYHADNGQFAENAFIHDCKTQGQSLSYCGVNAHFQNGIVERHIQDLQEQTRTSMLYMMNKWKQMILICLWPYAMSYANNITNAMPKKGEDSSPLEKFSGVKVVPKLRHFHAFGCPTYILDNALQSGQSAPKWRRRSRLGVYLGPSPNHAQSVALVLNPCTGHVSPQFHVKFDDFFETVQKKPTDLDAPELEWKYLSGFAIQKGQPKLSANGPLGDLIAPRQGPTTAILPTIPPAELTTQQQQPTIQPDKDDVAANVDDPPILASPSLPTQQAPAQVPQTSAACQTCSRQVITNTPRYDQSVMQRSQGLVAWEVLVDQDEREDVPTASTQYAIQKTLEDPIVFTASCNPDILYWDQAMKAHDRDKFIEAVGIELDDHEKMGNYEPIPIRNLPKGTKLIDMVWSMRRK